MLATVVPSVENGLISEDGLTYIFPIREGVKFHNGEILTPEDVEYTFERNMLADPAGSPMWMFFDPLLGAAGVEDYACTKAGVDSFDQVPEDVLIEVAKDVMATITVEGNNVVFHLAQPYPPFLSILARNCSWSVIVNKKFLIENGDWDGSPETWTRWHNLDTEDLTLFVKECGTGPYKLVSWDRNAMKHTLVAFEDYWQGPATIKTVVVDNSVTEFTTRKLMLQKGDADAIYVPIEYIPEAEMMEGVTVLRGLESLSNTAVLFNQTINAEDNPLVGSGKLDGNGVPPNFFSDVDVRRGFCYAFNYDAYIQEVALGEGLKPYGPLPAAFSEFFDTNMETYTYDLEKAAEHFKKAFGGELWEKGFKLTLVWNIPNTSRMTASQILEDGIERINPKFQIEVLGMDWPLMLEQRRQGRLPAVFIGWLADYADPYNFAYPYLYSQGDFMAYSGADGRALAKREFDPIIEASIKTADQAERIALYTELQKRAFEQAVHLVYIDSTAQRVHRDNIKGFVWDPIMPAPYDFYALSKE